ncbi:hypothetical protein GT347_15110 [Xylophilus rhododendri]|uniref:F-box domain-containing protein n=1 Tax=Xylophilus rhododendri TaxID=2697032 RepID=A0A857J5E0_9BURK|nr:F-box protein [Xylophilus rhododendri]QHI99190.1 hypothetical protein GT347_15110 [Xylophilus rhododendri]
MLDEQNDCVRIIRVSQSRLDGPLPDGSSAGPTAKACTESMHIALAPLESLPQELKAHIFRHIDWPDWAALRLTSRALRDGSDQAARDAVAARLHTMTATPDSLMWGMRRVLTRWFECPGSNLGQIVAWARIALGPLEHLDAERVACILEVVESRLFFLLNFPGQGGSSCSECYQLLGGFALELAGRCAAMLPADPPRQLRDGLHHRTLSLLQLGLSAMHRDPVAILHASAEQCDRVPRCALHLLAFLRDSVLDVRQTEYPEQILLMASPVHLQTVLHVLRKVFDEYGDAYESVVYDKRDLLDVCAYCLQGLTDPRSPVASDPQVVQLQAEWRALDAFDRGAPRSQ